jgi:hypothetical protein
VENHVFNFLDQESTASFYILPIFCAFYFCSNYGMLPFHSEFLSHLAARLSIQPQASPCQGYMVFIIHCFPAVLLPFAGFPRTAKAAA